MTAQEAILAQGQRVKDAIAQLRIEREKLELLVAAMAQGRTAGAVDAHGG